MKDIRDRFNDFIRESHRNDTELASPVEMVASGSPSNLLEELL